MTVMPQLSLDDFVSAEEIAALRRPAAEAHGLPGRVVCLRRLMRWRRISTRADRLRLELARPRPDAGWIAI